MTKPMAGDAVRMTGKWNWGMIEPGEIGIIGGLCNDDPEQELMITFKYSAFRGFAYRGSQHTTPDSTKTEFVSCSGGPATIALPSNLLTPTNDTVEVKFWCWEDSPRAGGGMSYKMFVPVWEWDGQGY